MKRIALSLCLAVTTGVIAGITGAEPATAAEREVGPRSVRFKGVIKAVDARTGRFVVPVSRGREGQPAAGMVDVLIHLAPASRIIIPAAEGIGPNPTAGRLQDLAPGLQVNVQGTILRDGSVAAQEVTLFRKQGGAEAEAGDRVSPETGNRASPEAGFRDTGKTREGAGPRDGEGVKKGPRDGEGAKFGPRDGEGRKFGPRDGEKRKFGPRDGEGRKFGPRDGEGAPKVGPRDGEGAPRFGPRDGEGVKAGPQEGIEAGWIHGKVKAIDLRRNAVLLQYRVGERGNLQNMQAVVVFGPNARLVHGRGAREGEQGAAAAFRDIQVGSILHVRGSQGPDGLYAAEARVHPLNQRQQPRAAGREGKGRPSAEGRRDP